MPISIDAFKTWADNYQGATALADGRTQAARPMSGSDRPRGRGQFPVHGGAKFW